jgi:hypothetical protein
MRYLLFSLLAIIIATGCSKKDTPSPNPPEIDLSTVQITEFKFNETDNVSINIDHPVITNGQQSLPGSINIILPHNQTSFELTPLISNFQKQGYTISPALGVKKDFYSEILYTITSTANPQKKVSYKIKVQKATDNSPLVISGFSFQKSDNVQFTEDITATRIIHEEATIGEIHVLVPAGTDFTHLKARITHNGEEIRYTQNAMDVPVNSPNIYPSAGLALDYKYPKGFYIALKRGTEVRTYSVLVDIINPIGISNDNVIISGLQSGPTQTIKVGEITNLGNRPITIKQILHTDQAPQGSNLRTFVTVPSGGILPGSKANISTTLTEGFFFPGTYGVKASFMPSFFQQPALQASLVPSVMNLKVELQ